MQRLASIKEFAGENEFVPEHFAYWFNELLYASGGFFAYLFVFTIGLTLLLFYQDRQETTDLWLAACPSPGNRLTVPNGLGVGFSPGPSHQWLLYRLFILPYD